MKLKSPKLAPKKSMLGFINPYLTEGIKYGADPDHGETNDPTVDAGTYSSTVTYSCGKLVLSSGTYYMYVGKLPAAGVALSNTSSWRVITNFLYLDATSGSDVNTYSSSPSTAKAAPIKSLSRLYALTSSSGTMPADTLIMMKRGETWGPSGGSPAGNIQLVHARYMLGAYGTRSLPRPKIVYDDPYSQSRGSIVWSNVPGTVVTNIWADADLLTRVDVASTTGFSVGDSVSDATNGATGTVVKVYAAFLMIHTASYNPQFTKNHSITNGTVSQNMTQIPSNISCYWLQREKSRFVNLTATNGGGGGVAFGVTDISETITDAAPTMSFSWTRSTSSFSSVTLNYSINGGSVINQAMTLSGSTFSTSITVAVGNTVDYSFSYVFNGFNYKSQTKKYVIGTGYQAGVSTGAILPGDETLIYNCIIDTCQKRQPNGAGVGGSGGGGIVIRYNSILSCGADPLLSHAMYVYDIAEAASYIEFNYLYDGANMGITSHGIENNLYFRYNDIYKCQNGIGFQSGYPTSERMDDITIAYNRVRNVGSGTQTAQGYGILVNCCPRMQIYGNLIYRPRIGGLSINQASSGGADAIANNVKVWNNTFYCDNDSTFYVLEVNGASLSAIEIKNNIIYNGTTVSSRYTLTKTGIANAELTLSNNLHYRPNNANTSLISWDGTARTLSYVQTTLGKEAGSISLDPQFVNLAGNKYRVKSSSPCKAAGTPVTITLDFLGNNRSSSTPTIGCYE